MIGEFKVRAVGMSWVPGYPDNIYALNEIATSRALESPVQLGGETVDMEPIPAAMVRDPANEDDPNAIQIHVPALGAQSMIAHIPRGVAARLAPCLDSGEVWEVNIIKVAIHPDHPDNPGIDLKITHLIENEPF